MIGDIDDEVAADIRQRTDAETAAEVAAVLDDLWRALENPAQVVERHREDELEARA